MNLVTQKESNDRLRVRSGTVTITGDKLVSFLYSLMRDHLPAGKLEELVMDCEYEHDEIVYTNGWLARYALDMAARLTSKDKL